ncbi:hypothetical protein DPMN_014867 [Dreissena polymorpha]|uniref:Uncharacterized protein n=1 Tax=Dreissena polymorpha TaxID=45954 RepID=A0A9D4NBS7_DREPO|nr:hypothetical protein DPMN_014867 [Dreissena polymorpha]
MLTASFQDRMLLTNMMRFIALRGEQVPQDHGVPSAALLHQAHPEESHSLLQSVIGETERDRRCIPPSKKEHRWIICPPIYIV